LCAYPIVALAVKASSAEVDFFIAQKNLFRLISGLFRAKYKPVAKQIGISALSRAGGQYQYFFTHL
jgi:hypothetical protein